MHEINNLSELLGITWNFLLAALCGAALGFERETQRKPSGLRTCMLISLGAALFTHASLSLTGGRGDPSRVAAQIVTGVGFLGAGAILHRGNDSVTGLTSAATVWVVAAFGMLAGAGNTLLALIGTAIAFLILHFIGRLEDRLFANYSKYHLYLDVTDQEGILSHIRSTFRRYGVPIQKLDVKAVEEGFNKIEIEYDAIKRTHQGILRKISALDGVQNMRVRIL